MAILNDPFKTYAASNYEKLMKSLYLGDCQFWPIYREEIKEVMNQNSPIKTNAFPRVTLE
jgi:hypothetical protein